MVNPTEHILFTLNEIHRHSSTKQSVPDPSPGTCNCLSKHGNSNTAMTKVMRDNMAALFPPHSLTLYGEADMLERLYRKIR